MKKELIVQLHANFEQCMQTEAESGTEFWLVRDLQKPLGYDRCVAPVGWLQPACVARPVDVARPVGCVE